jgi:flavin reductase (DIM6/NTAB) family NADH-FMN oxidoreductase RutF
MEMIEIRPGDFYKLLARPVVVVSTISPEGVPNAAPFSFCTPISFDPPIFGISCQPRHDTWKNIQRNGEFVINLIGEEMSSTLKILGKKFPYGVNEIEKAGLTEVKAKAIKPPRIGEAYGWLECKLVDSSVIGDHVVIAGEVVVAEAREGMMEEVVSLEKARPLCHLAKEFFTIPEKVIKIPR